MKHILTVIGARPQIIKAAAISRAIRTHYSGDLRESILHTGQHYDENMSEVFFRELGIPAPDFNLNCGSDEHGKQTAKMIEGIEEVLLKIKPDALLVYGDTNSTLAGAIAASKLQVPVIHIEAGLRSYNKSMPEEINRVVCDHLSTLLFSPTETGIKNLQKEGFSITNKAPFTADNPKIYHCGDIMFDNSLFFAEIAKNKEGIFSGTGLKPNEFVLATIHRNNNTDDAERLNSIFKALVRIADSGYPVLLPLHPRTRKCIDQFLENDLKNTIEKHSSIHILPPASFLEMIALERNAKLIVTDSGGVQKEAFFFGKPAVILRPETEWIELVELGAAEVADADEDKIVSAFQRLKDKPLNNLPAVFGDGKAAGFICREVISQLNK